MKGKKLLSMLTAGALAVTMVMPVMAADGGTVDVDVTTKTGILRVEVPTTLAIAVDQFETTDTGSQIFSEEFTIANKSEVNVKVNVTSTAAVKDGVALAAERADVATATATGGTAWLAVAAKKSASNYEAASGNDNFANLDESATNVTTFAKNGTAVTAAQTFYLEKATGAAYKTMKPAADEENNGVSYAQFYKLTEIATQPTDNATLKAEVDKSDVYVVATADKDQDDKAVTKIAKGATVDASTNTFAGTNTYYTAAGAATAKADLKATEVYVYGEMTTAGASQPEAAFRYIGELSRNKELWDATDISKVSIAYTIQGLPQTVYDEAATEGITYGLYKEKLPMVYENQSGKYYLSVDGRAGFAAAPSSVSVGGTAVATTDYTYHDNKWLELKNAPTAGDVILVVVNGTTYKTTVQ